MADIQTWARMETVQDEIEFVRSLVVRLVENQDDTANERHRWGFLPWNRRDGVFSVSLTLFGHCLEEEGGQ